MEKGFGLPEVSVTSSGWICHVMAGPFPYSPFVEGLFRAHPARTEAADNQGKHNSHTEAAGTWGSGLTSALDTPSYGADGVVGVFDTV